MNEIDAMVERMKTDGADDLDIAIAGADAMEALLEADPEMYEVVAKER